MTNFKRKQYGHCKECGKPVYIITGNCVGLPEYRIIGDDKICDECFKKNPKKYKIKKEGQDGTNIKTKS